MSVVQLSNYTSSPASAYSTFSLDGTNNATTQLDNGLLTYTYGIIADAQVQTGAPDWGDFAFGNGTVGIAYDAEGDMPFSATPITYSVLSGALPSGLSLVPNANTHSWSIMGTPTTAGTYTFTLRAVNPIGTADHSFSITIDPPTSGSGSVHVFAC